MVVYLFRSRKSLVAEVVALRHQLNVLLRRSGHKRPALSSFDRFVFLGLYRVVPRCGDDRSARNDYALASRWLSRLLALEVTSKKSRQTSGAHRSSAAHPRYEFSQPALGCSSHPWRPPQTRHQCRPNLSREVHDQAKTPSVTEVENVPSQSRQRDRLDRFVRRADDLI